MMRGYNKSGKLKFFMVIAVFVLFAGCAALPPPDTQPGEVVRIFASTGGSYDLMSEEYQNLTSRWAFGDIVNKCNPSDWSGHYKFVEVINGSEKIEGNIASVDIRYIMKKTDYYFNQSFENGTKTIYLVKEKSGWKLRELSCELRSK